MKDLKNKKFLLCLITVMGGQWFLYMLLKLFQENPHTFNFIIDSKIPFIPQLGLLYNLFYPLTLLCLIILFKKDQKEFYKTSLILTISYLIADIIFLIYPTTIIRPNLDEINMDFFSKFVMTLTYYFDNPAINCFPSEHCIFMFQMIISIYKAKNIKPLHKILIILTAFSIVLTTVLIKQHYVIDIIGALIIIITINFIIRYFNLYYKIRDYILKKLVRNN